MDVFGGVIRLQDNVSGVLKQASSSSKSFQSEIKKAKEELRKLDKEKLKEKNLRVKNSEAYKAIEGVKKKLDPIGKNVIQLKAKEELAVEKIRKVKNALAAVKDNKVVNIVVKGAEGAVKAAGKAAAAGAAAAFVTAGAAGAVAVNEAIEFQSEMANVATLLDGDITSKVASMGAEVKKISVDTGISAHNLSSGLYEVVSAFGESAESSKQLEIAAKAAKAGNAETAESVKMLAAVTKGYGDTSAEAVQKASDLAFMTVKLGQTSFSELASSMGQVIPLAATMKVSQEELFGAMATLTGVTGGTSEVTTQLKAVMQGFMSPTKEMAASLKQMGYASGAAALESESLDSILGKLKQSVNGDEVAFAAMFSSVEAKNAVLALAGTQAENFAAKTEAMKSASGAANEAFKRQTSSVKEMAARIKNTGLVVLMSAGEKVLPVLESGLNKVAAYMPQFEQAVSGTMEAMEPVFMAAGAAVTALWESWKPTLDNLSPVVSGVISSVSGTIQSAVPVVSTLFSGLSAVAAQVLPVIGTIVQGMGDKVSRVFEIVGNHTGTLQSIFSAAGPAISGILSAAWAVAGPVLDLAVEGFHLAASVAGWAFPYIQGVITSVWSVIEPVIHSIGTGIEAVAGMFQRAAALIGGSASEAGSNAAKVSAAAAKQPDGTGKNVGANANGTSFWKGGYTRLGEHGPEIVDLPTGAKVYSSSKTNNILNRDRNVNVNIQNVTVRSDDDVRKIAEEIVRELDKVDR